EMERAEALQRQPPQQPQHAAEPPLESQEPEDPLAQLPPRVRRWYQEHPELATDPERAAQVQYCHHVARRETGGEFTDPYFDRMEAMLFGATNGRAESRPSPAPSAARNVEPPPPRPQARPMSAPVSAPPTREVPSMSTGRSPRYRAPLTRDELEIAAACGQTPEQYQAQKERMMRMKANQEIQG